MKRLSVVMLLVGLFFAGFGVQATNCPLSKAKSACAKVEKASKCAKLTPAQKADKLQKYADNYKKLAAKMLAKGDKTKAAYYTKLSAVKSKMAAAVKKNDLKALEAAKAEYRSLKKCTKCTKTKKCEKCLKAKACSKTEAKACKK